MKETPCGDVGRFFVRIHCNPLPLPIGRAAPDLPHGKALCNGAHPRRYRGLTGHIFSNRCSLPKVRRGPCPYLLFVLKTHHAALTGPIHAIRLMEMPRHFAKMTAPDLPLEGAFARVQFTDGFCLWLRRIKQSRSTRAHQVGRCHLCKPIPDLTLINRPHIQEAR